jgi:hypothetical protein
MYNNQPYMISTDKSSSDLLQTIEPKGIADESMRHTVEILLNLIEQLQLKVKDLESENQRLKDENNRLKGIGNKLEGSRFCQYPFV